MNAHDLLKANALARSHLSLLSTVHLDGAHNYFGATVHLCIVLKQKNLSYYKAFVLGGIEVDKHPGLTLFAVRNTFSQVYLVFTWHTPLLDSPKETLDFLGICAEPLDKSGGMASSGCCWASDGCIPGTPVRWDLRCA